MMSEKDIEFMSQEILQLATALSHEKGLEVDEVLEALAAVLARVVSHENGKQWAVKAHICPETGELKLWRVWDVLAESEEIENPEAQVFESSEEAQKAGVKVGETIEEELPALNLRRVSARLSKQFLHQKLREISSRKRVSAFEGTEGQIVMGTVRRVDSASCYVEVRKFDLLLRRDAMIPGESFPVGARVCAVVDKVEDIESGGQVYISRTSPHFLKALFDREVPEVTDGLVQVIDCARDPGSRAKVSVYSRDATIDPVGACIGIRGVRIQAITNELCGEKIDIVLWSEDPAKYFINVFSAADVRRVVIDAERNAAEVVVSDETLSVAIGRNGQNVRLARQLIKKRVDLFCESESDKRSSAEAGERVDRLQQVLEIDEIMAHLLVLEGYNSVDSILQASKEDLLSIEGFNEGIVEELLERAAQVGAPDQENQGSSAQDVAGEFRAVLEREGIIHLHDLLVAGGVTKAEDLAWLAVDEFQEITKNAVDTAVATDIIMRLRTPLISE